MEYVGLNNGVKMPVIGFGVFQITDKEECERVVLDAIDVGYRLIDTAQAYGNEEAVGEAIAKSSVPREELFITTKVWISNSGYEKAKASIESSLKKMKLDYLDLVLIHQPVNDYYGTYRAMQDLYKEGKIKAIGVNEIKPAVNQFEINPFHQQLDAQTYNQKYNVQLQAWAPFAEGKNGMFENQDLKTIGEKYNKSVAQVILRWLLQRGIVPLAKTVNKQRMLQNIDVFNFKLSEDDMNKISSLDKKESSFFNHQEASAVEMLASLVR